METRQREDRDTYLACLARLLRDISSRLDTMRKEEPLNVDMCGAVEKRVDFGCFEVVEVKGFGGLEVGK